MITAEAAPKQEQEKKKAFKALFFSPVVGESGEAEERQQYENRRQYLEDMMRGESFSEPLEEAAEDPFIVQMIAQPKAQDSQKERERKARRREDIRAELKRVRSDALGLEEEDENEGTPEPPLTRTRLIALKLAGKQLLDRLYGTSDYEGQRARWENMSEEERASVRVAEMVILGAELEWLKMRAELEQDGKISPITAEQARRLQSEFRRYMQNKDIPPAFLEKLADGLKHLEAFIPAEGESHSGDALEETQEPSQRETITTRGAGQTRVGFEEPEEYLPKDFDLDWPDDEGKEGEMLELKPGYFEVDKVKEGGSEGQSELATHVIDLAAMRAQAGAGSDATHAPVDQPPAVDLETQPKSPGRVRKALAWVEEEVRQHKMKYSLLGLGLAVGSFVHPLVSLSAFGLFAVARWGPFQRQEKKPVAREFNVETGDDIQGLRMVAEGEEYVSSLDGSEFTVVTIDEDKEQVVVRYSKSRTEKIGENKRMNFHYFESLLGYCKKAPS